ncbi:Ectonucleotide pyrophosphatase/phosphodiesterase C27A7.1 [Aphelenchoides fujianensis]|nr:Ectonucleotide pyrophosphatase/phosphodiesterase C27A7.1 [Aphelenchoides fujianensis]
MTLVEIPLCSPPSTPKLGGSRDFSQMGTESSQVRLRDFRPERRHVLAAILLAILLVAIGVCGGLILVRLFGHRHVEDASFLNADQSWQSTCTPRCTANFDVPPLLLISLDGFRVEYLRRDITPAINRVYNCGAHSSIYASFPSKTFPNHLSIITGLFPESHGITNTKFVDYEISDLPFSPKTAMPAFFHGEPIWNTAYNNGKKSATFFWPGSEVLINGKKPTFAIKYNSSIPFSKRVDQVIEWLELPTDVRPAFFGMYFEDPDRAGHHNGTHSDAMKMSLIVADAMLNYLLSRLDRKGYLGCVNLVLVSDHGMASLRQDEHPMVLEEFLNVSDPNLFVASGVVSNVHYRNKTNVDVEKEMKSMKCLKGQRFYAMTPETIPKRYHYGATKRVGDIVLESSFGHTIYATKDDAKKDINVGDHGYDYVHPHMQAIFGATGPSIKRGAEIQPFQNVELYNLFIDLMQLPFSAPNNGTRGLLYPILKSPPDYEHTPMVDLPQCFGVSLAKCGSRCTFKIHTAPSENVGCIRLERMSVPEALADTSNLCTIGVCNATMIYDRDTKRTKMIDLFDEQDYARYIAEAHVYAPAAFVEGIYKEFKELLKKYRKHYKQLLMWKGPIFDANNDGLMDDVQQIRNSSRPTHVFVILLRCKSGEWHRSGRYCQTAESTSVLSFMIPLQEDFNCLFPMEYLFRHTARVRDIELATGLEFFADRSVYPPELALRLRTRVIEKLWQMEQNEKPTS